MTQTPTIAVIGAGRLGISLAQTWRIAGFNVLLGARNPTQVGQQCVDAGVRLAPDLTLCTPLEAVTKADVVLLTVTDNQIELVCQELAPYLDSRQVIAHCSGALNSQALLTAHQGGCPTCSVHPLNSFPSAQAGCRLLSNPQHASVCYGEGDAAALELLFSLFQEIGFRPRQLTLANKTLYHVACVFACNYLNVLMESSMRSADHAGVDREEFWSALQPLLRDTLENISEQGPASALSGPIARGDAATLSRHLEELSKTDKRLHDDYRQLARGALALAEVQNHLSDEQLAQLRKSLQISDSEF